jgi:branched-subunit amino acid transport protein
MEVKIFPLLIGMMAVTYLPRVSPLVLLSRMDMPPLVLKWLSFIPVAVLASLLGPELLLREGDLNLSLHNPFLLAAIPSFAIAIKTKNLFYTVFMGMACMVLAGRLLV